MQTNPNRLLQKSHEIGTQFRDFTIQEVQDVVRNGLILYPTLPAIQLAEVLAEGLDPELAPVLSKILLCRFFRRAILVERRKQSASNDQPCLPGFEHLPWNLGNATYSGVRKYYWSLVRARNVLNERRKRNDPRIQEAKALVEKMRRASRSDKRITVKTVLGME